MSFRLYRFEVLEEIGGEGANTIYAARDTADSSSMHLYEWTPLPRESLSAAESLSRLTAELDGVEAFTSGPRFYVAASSTGQARKALELLRSHNLFLGVWPGVLEDPSSASEADKQPESTIAQTGPGVRPGEQVTPAGQSLKAPRARLWLIAMLVVIAVVAGIVIATLDSKSVAPVKPVNQGNEQQRPRVDQDSAARRAAQDAAAKRAVQDAVDSWVQAFRSRDTSGLAACYAPSVEIVEKYSGKVSGSIRSRESIQSELERAFGRIIEIKKYEVDSITIEILADGRAVAHFHKEWETPLSDGRTYAGDERDKLTFTDSSEGWKIIREEHDINWKSTK